MPDIDGSEPTSQHGLEPGTDSERYLTFLNHLQDVVIAIDDQAAITFNNAPPDNWFHDHAVACLAFSATAAHRLLDIYLKPLAQADLPLQQALRENFQDREIILETPDRPHRIWLSVSGGPLPGGGAIVALRDISDRKQQEANVFHQGLYDDVTQLPNRNLLSDRIGFALAQGQQGRQSLMALLLIGCHQCQALTLPGSGLSPQHMLPVLGQRLKQSIRPEDTVARVGAHTFGVLLEKVATCSAAIEIVERLQQAMAEPFVFSEKPTVLDISIGIALGPLGYLHPEDWLQDAEAALAKAQAQPELGWWMAENSLQVQQDQRLQLEIDLRQAIMGNELRLQYQPIVNMQTREVIGFEALVRWQHPRQGLLSPNTFIPIAEETGLIIPLGWWVLRAACHQMQMWTETLPQAQGLRLSVNMSSKQFFQKSLIEKFKAILEETGFSPHRLSIEITEGVLIEHSDSIIATLQQLQAMGIRLSIDDFGTGYSSLSYLHRFPFNTLKIDRSFIDNADQDFDKLEILQSVVRLAWNLGLDVVAEGVETQKHYAQLKALRCESGQGNLFARPLSPEAAEALINQQGHPPVSDA